MSQDYMHCWDKMAIAVRAEADDREVKSFCTNLLNQEAITWPQHNYLVQKFNLYVVKPACGFQGKRK